MSHTYTNLVVHALFSTKNRHAWLDAEIRDELFHYLGGKVNHLGGHSLLVNGPRDHVHMLFVQPASLPVSTMMEKVKANSSGWVKKRWQARSYFGWQTGYTAFSVSRSQVDRARCYIASQTEHHRKMGFQEEVLTLLKKHGVEFDPRYVFA